MSRIDTPPRQGAGARKTKLSRDDSDGKEQERKERHYRLEDGASTPTTISLTVRRRCLSATLLPPRIRIANYYFIYTPIEKTRPPWSMWQAGRFR